MATVNPYEQYANAYKAQQNAVNAANDAQVLERQNRERLAQQNLAAGNRTVTNTYKNAVNPYGSAASQTNGMSSAVTDYRNNAAYGNMLKGLGANQQNYTEAMNNSNALWNNWLAQKAGQEAENEANYADRTAAQGNTDRAFEYQKERDAVSDTRWQTEFDYNKAIDERNFGYQQQRDTVADTQWQTEMNRQLNRDAVADKQWQAEMDRMLANDKVSQQQWQAEMNRALANDKISQQQWQAEMNRALANDKISQSQWQAEMNRMLANDKTAQAQWEAEQAENKRRYDQEWAYQMEQAAKAAASGGSGGSRTGSNPGIEIPDEEPTTKTYNSTVGAQDSKKSVYVVSDKTTASSIPGKAYRDIKYSDGTTKRMVVDATPTLVTNKNGTTRIVNSAKTSSGTAKK